jgi:hypothetical protein
MTCGLWAICPEPTASQCPSHEIAAISFDPLAFIERPAALVPRPRAHQHTYHGVLAPAASYRDLIVLGPRESATAIAASAACAHTHDCDPPRTRRSNPRRSTWAELLQRVSTIDVLTCSLCGGHRKLIALISNGPVVRRILDRLGLPTEPPDLAPARRTAELPFDA